MKVSMFQSTKHPLVKIPTAPKGKRFIHYAGAHVSFEKILEAIQAKKYESLIDSIKHDYPNLKKLKLPCFTPSGTFRLRWDNDLLSYSQIICLDYDKLGSGSILSIKNKVEKIPYTFAAFLSPSFAGIKIFVKVDSKAELHNIAYDKVSSYYNEALGLSNDSKCKNVSRLCFISSDPDLVYNQQSQVFTVGSSHTKNEDTGATLKNVLLASTDKNPVARWLYEFTLQKLPEGFATDSRNNFMYVYCCNANRYGITKDLAQSWAVEMWQSNPYDFDYSEVLKTVNSAYSNTHEHGKFSLPNI